MEWVIGIAVAAALVIVAIARVRRQDHATPSDHQKKPLSDSERAMRSPETVLAPSAIEWLRIIEGLRSLGAQWPEILAALNPKGDAGIQRALIALRGPHQFVPHVGLNVLETGCRRALERNPRAGQMEALQESLRSASIVIDVGN